MARRFEEAWRNLAAAIQSSPDHLDVLYQQGRTAALAGESPPLSLEPDHNEARKALKKLR